MKLYFNSEDLKRLEQIDENQLYQLNYALWEVTNDTKRLCLADKQLIRELVALTETAAKEIACRKRWSPKPSNGEYSIDGITYDIEEYRKWLGDCRRTSPDKDLEYADVLCMFSFGVRVLELSLNL